MQQVEPSIVYSASYLAVFTVRCRTPLPKQLADAFCRYHKLAEPPAA